MASTVWESNDQDVVPDNQHYSTAVTVVEPNASSINALPENTSAVNTCVAQASASQQSPQHSPLSQDQWQHIKQQLRAEVGDPAYNSWLAPLSLAAVVPIVQNGERSNDRPRYQAVLTLPTSFMRNWVETRYGDRLRNLMKAAAPAISYIELAVEEKAITEQGLMLQHSTLPHARPTAAAHYSLVENAADNSALEDLPLLANEPTPQQSSQQSTNNYTPNNYKLAQKQNTYSQPYGEPKQHSSGLPEPGTSTTAFHNTNFQQPQSQPGAVARPLQQGGQQAYQQSANIQSNGQPSRQPNKQEGFKEGFANGVRLDPRFTFDNFVVGKSNELAFAAARRVAEAQQVDFNPLFLYGGVGLGKTHLMHAIAWHITSFDPNRRILYLSAEKFMFEFIRALRFKDTMSFKEQFRSVDILMIDDVQFISGKDSTQEEFFHTFNALVDQNRQVIISADKSPSDLEGMEERLKSRLGWGLVADIHPAAFELRLGILQDKAEKLPVDVPMPVLEFLATKISSNVRELEGALNRIAAHATLIGHEITVDTCQVQLADMLRNSDRTLSIDDIQNKVAAYYNVRVSDMHSARRARVYVRPRQVAMYLAKTMTPHSLPEIGRQFGGRDHTTVMHAIRTIERNCEIDATFAAEIQRLQQSLEL